MANRHIGLVDFFAAIGTIIPIISLLPTSILNLLPDIIVRIITWQYFKCVAIFCLIIIYCIYFLKGFSKSISFKLPKSQYDIKAEKLQKFSEQDEKLPFSVFLDDVDDCRNNSSLLAWLGFKWLIMIESPDSVIVKYEREGGSFHVLDERQGSLILWCNLSNSGLREIKLKTSLSIPNEYRGGGSINIKAYIGLRRKCLERSFLKLSGEAGVCKIDILKY